MPARSRRSPFEAAHLPLEGEECSGLPLECVVNGARPGQLECAGARRDAGQALQKAARALAVEKDAQRAQNYRTLGQLGRGALDAARDVQRYSDRAQVLHDAWRIAAPVRVSVSELGKRVRECLWPPTAFRDKHGFADAGEVETDQVRRGAQVLLRRARHLRVALPAIALPPAADNSVYCNGASARRAATCDHAEAPERNADNHRHCGTARRQWVPSRPCG